MARTNQTSKMFHLGTFPLSNIFSYRKHISSKNNISVLTISSKSRNIKTIAPSPPFSGIVSTFPEGHFIMTPPPPPTHFKIFFWITHPMLIRHPLQLSTEEYLKCLHFQLQYIYELALFFRLNPINLSSQRLLLSDLRVFLLSDILLSIFALEFCNEKQLLITFENCVFYLYLQHFRYQRFWPSTCEYVSSFHTFL